MSEKIDNGGPAFPTLTQFTANGDVMSYGVDGMTLRDYFAAKAMGGMLADPDVTVDYDKGRRLAELSYKLADAMLAARSAA